MKIVRAFAKGKSALAAILLVPVLLLSACGGAQETATPSTAGGAGVTTPVVAPTDTAAAAAPTDTTAAAPTDTTAAEEATPTEAAGGGGPVSAGATPVSDWQPGKYANSIQPPAKLVTAGTLTVGSDTTYPPQEYIDASGKAVGLDIDIAYEIASRLGLTPKIVTFKFDDIIPALSAGQFDMVISAMTITDERKQVVDFVQYFEAGQAVMVKKGNPLGIKSLDDLSGHTVAVQSGTVEEQTLKDLNEKLAKDSKPAVKVLTYTADTDAVDNLRVGRADASMHDSPVAAYYSKLNPDFEVAVPNFDPAPQGVVVAKNNPDMLKVIQQAMDAMKSDGTLNAIMGKWGVK